MDVVRLSIGYQFARGRIAIGWRDVRFGIENDLVDGRFPIERALDQLDDSESSRRVIIDLSTSSGHASTKHMVDQLADAEEPLSDDELSRRWLYLALAWLYENRFDDPDPLQRVEEVYADFGYPVEISNFVRYMPMDGPDLGSREANEGRLFERWGQYLDVSARGYGKR